MEMDYGGLRKGKRVATKPNRKYHPNRPIGQVNNSAGWLELLFLPLFAPPHFPMKRMKMEMGWGDEGRKIVSHTHAHIRITRRSGG